MYVYLDNFHVFEAILGMFGVVQDILANMLLNILYLFSNTEDINEPLKLKSPNFKGIKPNNIDILNSSGSNNQKGSVSKSSSANASGN